MIDLEIIKKLMTESGIKYQIQSHHELSKFGRIHHVIVTNKPDADAMKLDDFVERSVDEYNEYINDVKAAVTAAVRSGGRVSNQIILFSDSALLLLRELAGLAKTLDDDYFIISFAEQTSETTGLRQFVQPVISVIDISEEEPINLITLENLKFVFKNVGYNCYYSAYDITDMMSIGNQVSLLTEKAQYDSLSVIRHRCLSEIYEYQCLEFFTPIQIDPKISNHDIEQLLLEANQKLSEQEIFTCKSCGKHYTISEDEKKWYAGKGFKLPKKCASCRYDERQKRRRDERAEQMKEMYRELGFGVLD